MGKCVLLPIEMGIFLIFQVSKWVFDAFAGLSDEHATAEDT